MKNKTQATCTDKQKQNVADYEEIYTKDIRPKPGGQTTNRTTQNPYHNRQ